MEAAHRTSLAKGEVGIREKKAVPTLAQFCHDRVEPWSQALFEQNSVNTWRWYRAGLRSIYNYPQIANLKLDQITGEAAADFAAHRQEDGLEVASVNASLRVLRRILKLAVEWGLIASMPKVKLLRGERHRERVITPQEEERYLAAAPHQLAAVATILFDTGMRPDELYRLRWEDVTFVNGRYGTLLITHGKTRSARRILPLTARVRTVLEARWEAAGKPLEGFIWLAPTKSGHIDHSSLKKQHESVFREVNLEAEKSEVPPLKRFVLYSLRHTFLTRLAEGGCDAWTLARIAGWSDISISKRYVHPSEDAVLVALSRLNTPPNRLGNESPDAECELGQSANRQLPATVSATPRL